VKDGEGKGMRWAEMKEIGREGREVGTGRRFAKAGPACPHRCTPRPSTHYTPQTSAGELAFSKGEWS